MNVLGAGPGIREKRSERAKKATVIRARRQELRVQETAQRIINNYQIGPAEDCFYCGQAHCFCCGKVLIDPGSIERGVGPECWKHVLNTAERFKAKQAAKMAS